MQSVLSELCSTRGTEQDVLGAVVHVEQAARYIHKCQFLKQVNLSTIKNNGSKLLHCQSYI